MEPAAFLVSPGFIRRGDLRSRKRRRLRLPRLVVRARVAHLVGMRVALCRRKRRAGLERGRRDPHRGPRRRSAKRPVRPAGLGRGAAAGAGRSDRRTFRHPLRFHFGRPLRERAGDRRARQYPFARNGVRRHRERGGGPASRHRHLKDASVRDLLDIRIGTMIRANAPDPAAQVRKIVELGFESIEPFFWQTVNKDLPVLATQLREAIGGADVTIDTLGMFGNPLEDGDLDRQTLAGWVALIDNAHHFGARTIAGFTGRVRNQPIEASLPQFKTVWGELSRRAADRGVRLAFENCAMNGNWASGDWNIAHNPDAWELMFDAVPADNLGLEWEPCHQLVYLIDPVPQIRKWAKKFFHVHGKDATVRWDVVREHGVFGKYPFVQMRTPGFGDTDWTRVISELRLAGYSGTIDIEGRHDPVYRDELEMTGQVRALDYLKQCRGGARAVPNPG